MKILQLTCHFRPNVGGVETHLDDLVAGLTKRNHDVFVLTYRPLSVDAPYLTWENGERYTIFRIPWIAGFFYKFVHNPLLEFLYLLPGIFVVTPYIILLQRPNVIHAHGLVAGFVGVFWGKAFGIRTVIATHSLYHFPKKGVYRNFVAGVFKRADAILTLSTQSAQEVEDLGVNHNKIKVFTYWVDLDKFRFMNKDLRFKNQKRLGWENKFVVLFVGRLVPEKGITELLDAAKLLNENVIIAVVGSGPMEGIINNKQKTINSIKFLGKLDQDKLPEYYSAVDMVIVPSTHDEGFGRVILESLACGTPVIGSNRGAIPEAMDNSVGVLIDVTPENIVKAIKYFHNNPKEVGKLSKNARIFAEKRYSEENIKTIINAYQS